MFTVFNASALLSFAYAQETLQPLPASIAPVSLTQTGDVDPSGINSECLSLSTDLRYKMKDATLGGDVSDLQSFLIGVNLMQGESTGYFGAGTLKAVKLFQQKQGLKATGFVGPLTRARVNTLSCGVQVQNLGDGSQQIGRPQRQMPDGTENDMKSGRADENSTFPGMMNGSSSKRNDDDKQGRDMRQVPTNSSVLMSYISDTDKAALKTKEDALKSAEETLKTYYVSVKGSTMTDDTKAQLQTLKSASQQAHKDLDDTRKSIFDNLKTTLTDAQKQKIEMTVRQMQQGRQDGSTSGTKNERKESGDSDSRKGKSTQVRMKMPAEREGGFERGDPETKRGDMQPGVIPQVPSDERHVIVANCTKGPC